MPQNGSQVGFAVVADVLVAQILMVAAADGVKESERKRMIPRGGAQASAGSRSRISQAHVHTQRAHF